MSDNTNVQDLEIEDEEEVKLLTALVQLKQHLKRIAATPCERKTAVGTCKEQLIQDPCGCCYAKEVLAAEQSLETPGEKFNVVLDNVSDEPCMILSVSRNDDKGPLLTDTNTKPREGIQELLLRLAGVTLDHMKNDPAFKATAAKWGFTFEVAAGPPRTGPGV